MDEYFEVSASWMKACGYPEKPCVLRITKKLEFPFTGKGFQLMFEVDHNGYKWTVAEGRGRYLGAHATAPEASVS